MKYLYCFCVATMLASCVQTDPNWASNPLDTPAYSDRTEWHPEAEGRFGPFGNGFNRYQP